MMVDYSQYSPSELPHHSAYGYEPNTAVNSLALGLFAIAAIVHIILTFRYKKYWTLLLPLGALVECAGYAGRIYSSSSIPNLFDMNGFLVQICLLVISPVLFAAVNYTILGLLVFYTGLQSSSLASKTGTHKYFTIIFVTCDVISLVMQAIGGAMASIASQKHTSTFIGTNIMVAGIAFQTFTTAIFMGLAIDYAVRCYKEKSCLNVTQFKSWKIIMFALAISSIFIETRSLYRSVELGQGWSGYLITHEPYFLVLDSLMMLLYIYTLAIIFPGKYIQDVKQDIEMANMQEKLPAEV